MSTLSVKQNIIYGLGEGGGVADATVLSYALRWANRAYKTMMLRYRFKCLRTRTVFRTVIGQPTYQAPSDFGGFLTMKDEENDNIIDQVTPEELQRVSTSMKVTDEDFTSVFDTAVSLANKGIQQYSETVTNVAGTTTYTRTTDYTMNYITGTITVLSTGTMANATAYHIDYVHKEDGKPARFCIEYDGTNARFIFRFDPVPDAIYPISMIYPALPSTLSGSVDSVWEHFETCIEAGGIYYGSLEIVEDANKQQIFKRDFEENLQALIQLDSDLVPKNDQIKVVMRKSDA